MLKKILYLIILLVLVVAYSCGDNSQEGPMGPTVKVVTVSPAAATVSTNDTVSFSAIGGSGTYYWTLSQPGIGSISDKGVFTPMQPGETTVICTDSRGVNGSSRILVSKNIVYVTPAASTIEYYSTLTFTATGGSTTSYFWWVEPPTVYGSISQTGLFESKGVSGACTISATDGSGNVGTAQLIIKGISVGISPSEVTLSIGNTITFTATGGSGSYRWTSSDTAVGTVSATTGTSVTFTAVSAGTTTVTVTDTDGSSAAAVATVLTAGGGGVGALILIPDSISLEKGETYQFAAYGGSEVYVWSIDDSNIGSIDSAGLFTAGTNIGSAVITVTDSLGATDTATVTILDSPISISPSTATIAIGSNLTLVGSGGLGTFWWSSSDSSVATVPVQSSTSATVTLTALDIGIVTLNAVDNNGSIGTATITVIAPTAVNIAPSTATLAVGTDMVFVGTGGVGTFWWSSSDSSVITVPTQTVATSTVTLTAVGTGTANLNAVDDDGNVATATVTVVAAAPISISPPTATLAVGTDMTFVGTGGIGTYWWSTSDISVATVPAQGSPLSSTTLSATGIGTTTLNVIDDDGNAATATITVIASAPVVISPPAATITVGSNIIIVGSGGNGAYWWSSSDALNATVSAQIVPNSTTVVTALGVATVTIYAIDDNGNLGTATITIN
jgi:plastocyanin